MFKTTNGVVLYLCSFAKMVCPTKIIYVQNKNAIVLRKVKVNLRNVISTMLSNNSNLHTFTPGVDSGTTTRLTFLKKTYVYTRV